MSSRRHYRGLPGNVLWKDLTSSIREVMVTFHCEEIPLSQDFNVTFEGLTIRCMVESVVSLTFPGEGLPDWGVTGSGELPCAVKWKPAGLKRQFNVEASQRSELWLFEDGRFEINQKFEVQLPEEQLSKLSKEEEKALRLSHRECAPGRFRCFKIER